MEQLLKIINPDVLIPVLISVIVSDVMLGVIKSLKLGTFEAKVMLKGLDKQVLIVIPVGLAFAFDRLIPSSNGMFLNMTCLFYIAYEGGSIIENLGTIGFPLPAFIKNMFKVIETASSKSTSPITPTVTDDKTI